MEDAKIINKIACLSSEENEFGRKKKRGQLFEPTPGFCLVAGAGFEPATFGL
jgi:hypothetical protein